MVQTLTTHPETSLALLLDLTCALMKTTKGMDSVWKKVTRCTWKRCTMWTCTAMSHIQCLVASMGALWPCSSFPWIAMMVRTKRRTFAGTVNVLKLEARRVISRQLKIALQIVAVLWCEFPVALAWSASSERSSLSPHTSNLSFPFQSNFQHPG